MCNNKQSRDWECLRLAWMSRATICWCVSSERRRVVRLIKSLYSITSIRVLTVDYSPIKWTHSCEQHIVRIVRQVFFFCRMFFFFWVNIFVITEGRYANLHFRLWKYHVLRRNRISSGWEEICKRLNLWFKWNYRNETYEIEDSWKIC